MAKVGDDGGTLPDQLVAKDEATSQPNSGSFGDPHDNDLPVNKEGSLNPRPLSSRFYTHPYNQKRPSHENSVTFSEQPRSEASSMSGSRIMRRRQSGDSFHTALTDLSVYMTPDEEPDEFFVPNYAETYFPRAISVRSHSYASSPALRGSSRGVRPVRLNEKRNNTSDSPGRSSSITPRSVKSCYPSLSLTPMESSSPPNGSVSSEPEREDHPETAPSSHEESSSAKQEPKGEVFSQNDFSEETSPDNPVVPLLVPFPLALNITGEHAVIRREFLLCRIEWSEMAGVPSFYNKRDAKRQQRRSQGWREYDVVLHPKNLILYKRQTRVKYQISLTNPAPRLSLFSPLDKSIKLVLDEEGFEKIFVLKAQTQSQNRDWYLALHRLLPPTQRPSLPECLDVAVPELDVHVRIPLHLNHEIQQGTANMTARAVISCIWQVLKREIVWSEVLARWRFKDLSLCWKRCGRLEWIGWDLSVDGMGRGDFVLGPEIYERTHQLEMRLRTHYPSWVDTPQLEGSAGDEAGRINEPPAIEGFLTRQTTRLGKKVKKLKRHYFMTSEHLLFFLPMSKAVLPGKPDSSSTNISIKMETTVHTIEPHQEASLQNGRAYFLQEQVERRASLLSESVGVVDLLQVESVRMGMENNAAKRRGKAHGNKSKNAPNLQPKVTQGEGSSQAQADNASREPSLKDAPPREESPVFSLHFNNGSSMQLRESSKAMAEEWVSRLNDLVLYWRKRRQMDITARARLQRLNQARQFANREGEAGCAKDYENEEGERDVQEDEEWSHNRSISDPEIWHWCVIDGCRSLTKFGILYLKFKPRATYQRRLVVLTPRGFLTTFGIYARNYFGRALPTTFHDRRETIPLAGSHVYTGHFAQEDDPAANAGKFLPRIFADGVISLDDEEKCMFCIALLPAVSRFSALIPFLQFGEKKSGPTTFSSERSKHKSTRLKGRIYFKARSQLERDEWVVAISSVIERIARWEGKLEREWQQQRRQP
ncbi:uncharacterized protein VTP21DRAFT_8978 [Calcarisporiella thermophila]|uniref:uncharacterized protein n=1 Tax=Calcarisporiella thermophila TaxID=911321 RepID=UPI003742C976